MYQSPDPASLVVEGKCGPSLYEAPSPEKLFNGIILECMVICSRNGDIAFRAYKILISHQVVSAAIAEPGKEKTKKVIQKIVKVTHAAMQNYSLKDTNIECNNHRNTIRLMRFLIVFLFNFIQNST